LIIGDHKKIWSRAKTIFGAPSLPPLSPPFPPNPVSSGSSRDIPTIIITPNNNKKPPREVGAAHPMGKKEESRMEPSHTYFYHTTRSKATIGR
jgi:hypothetical protein